MAKKKLPTATQATEPQVKQPRVKQPEEDATPEDEVQWVNIQVPVFLGNLGNANVPDRMDTRLIGRDDKNTTKRVARGLEFTGTKLKNGKQSTGAAQDVGLFLIQAIGEKCQPSS